MASGEPWYRRLWGALSTVSTLSGMWTIAVALWSGLGAQRVILYSPDHPAKYWLATFSVMIGAAAIVQTGISLTKWAAFKVKHKRNPPTLVITALSGDQATLELTHSGEPATWVARARIVAVDGGNRPIPDSRWHDQAISTGDRLLDRVSLAEGGVAHIKIASIGSYDWSPSRLEVIDTSLIHAMTAAVEILIRDDAGARAYLKRFEVIWRPAFPHRVEIQEQKGGGV